MFIKLVRYKEIRPVDFEIKKVAMIFIQKKMPSKQFVIYINGFA